MERTLAKEITGLVVIDPNHSITEVVQTSDVMLFISRDLKYLFDLMPSLAEINSYMKCLSPIDKIN